MTRFSRTLAGLTATSLIMVATAPAIARDRYDDRRWSHHHDHGPSAGAVIGTIAAIGLLASLASASAERRRAQAEADMRYRSVPPLVERPSYDQSYDDRYQDGPSDYDDGYGYASPGASSAVPPARGFAADDEDSAVNACVAAAEAQGSRNGDVAQVRGIDGVRPMGDNGFDVFGRIERRSSYRDNDGNVRDFSCAFSYGRVSAVTLY